MQHWFVSLQDLDQEDHRVFWLLRTGFTIPGFHYDPLGPKPSRPSTLTPRLHVPKEKLITPHVAECGSSDNEEHRNLGQSLFFGLNVK